MLRLTLLGVLAAVAACAPTGDVGAVLVEVQTDFVPGREFRSIRVSIAAASTPSVEIASDARDVVGGMAEEAAFRTGLRVAELSELHAGAYRVTGALRDGAGDLVAERTVLVDVGTTTRGVRVVVTRACAGIECPGAGPAELSECEGGRCVDPRCGADGSSGCPVPACMLASDCTSAAACAIAGCTASGTCLSFADSSRCTSPQVCDPERGCVDPVTPMPDGGLGADAGSDAGMPWSPDLDPALVLWLRFEESGDTHPSSAEAGELVARCAPGGACPTSVTGVNGMGASFDGSDDHLVIDHGPALVTPSGFTIAAWVALDAVPATRTHSIVSKPFDGSFRNSWQLAVLDGDSDGEGELAFVMDEAGAEATQPAEIAVAAGTFVHLAGVYDGRNMRLYVDGASTGAGIDLSAPLFDSSDVLVGADSNGGAVVDYLAGVVDELRLYSRALSAGEVATLHARR